MKNLRKINTFLALCLSALVLLHGIMGSFELLGIGTHAGTMWAWVAVGIGAAHAVVGAILTFRTLKVQKKSGGRWYLQENAIFWIRRITGIAIILLVLFHMGIFGKKIDGVYTLLPFTTLKLIATILLIAFVFIHLFANVRPVLVSMAVIRFKEWRTNLILILTVIFLFITVSILLYYISWHI